MTCDSKLTLRDVHRRWPDLFEILNSWKKRLPGLKEEVMTHKRCLEDLKYGSENHLALGWQQEPDWANPSSLLNRRVTSELSHPFLWRCDDAMSLAT